MCFGTNCDVYSPSNSKIYSNIILAKIILNYSIIIISTGIILNCSIISAGIIIV